MNRATILRNEKRAAFEQAKREGRVLRIDWSASHQTFQAYTSIEARDKAAAVLASNGVSHTVVTS